MGDIDISKAERPARVRVGGVDVERMKEFRRRFPPAAKRHLYIRDHLHFPERDPAPNPEKMEMLMRSSKLGKISDLNWVQLMMPE